MKLTAKQEKFCLEYLIDLNATQAAIRAGYSEKTSFTIGHENLKKPYIGARISELQQEIQNRTTITIDKVVKELGKLAFVKINDFYQDGELIRPETLEDDIASSVQSFKNRVEIVGDISYSIDEYKMYDKTKALDMLMKHLGGYSAEIKEETAPTKHELIFQVMPKND